LSESHPTLDLRDKRRTTLRAPVPRLVALAGGFR
jgi:hypothetical protein